MCVAKCTAYQVSKLILHFVCSGQAILHRRYWFVLCVSGLIGEDADRLTIYHSILSHISL